MMSFSCSVIVLVMDGEPLLQCTQEHFALDLWKKPKATSQRLICTLILADRRSDSRREMALKINLVNFLMAHECVKILQVNRTLVLWFVFLLDIPKTYSYAVLAVYQRENVKIDKLLLSNIIIVTKVYSSPIFKALSTVPANKRWNMFILQIIFSNCDMLFLAFPLFLPVFCNLFHSHCR